MNAWIRCTCHTEGRHLVSGVTVVSEHAPVGLNLNYWVGLRRTLLDNWGVESRETREAQFRLLSGCYHASPEAQWNFAPIRKRSHGRCERITEARRCPRRASVVHHEDYEWWGREREHPDSCRDLCNACHAFVHGKIDHDPIVVMLTPAHPLLPFWLETESA